VTNSWIRPISSKKKSGNLKGTGNLKLLFLGRLFSESLKMTVESSGGRKMVVAYVAITCTILPNYLDIDGKTSFVKVENHKLGNSNRKRQSGEDLED